MTKIDISELDAALLADIDGDTSSWVLYEVPAANASVANQRVQILFSSDHNRAGIVFCGSGSSGVTSWTDASTPEQAYERYTNDDMRP
jgi:hypothetical protein